MDKTIKLDELVKLLKPICEKKDYIIEDETFPSVTVEHAMEKLSDVLMRVTAEQIKEDEKPLEEFHKWKLFKEPFNKLEF